MGSYDEVSDTQRVTVVGSGTGASSTQVQGTAADNAAASGNPVREGGVYNTTPPTYANGDIADAQADVNGNRKVVEQYIPTYEDNTNQVAKVEQRYGTSGFLTADTLIKTGAGFIHTITFSQNDAAPTAGTIDVYDNTAGSGTKIFSWTLDTTVFRPFSITLDVTFATGIYLDFTTTADVGVVISYR